MTRLLAALLLTTAPAFAETAVGLSGDKTLVWIDTATATVTGTVEVQGVERLHGIDWRPGNQTLIGVTDQQAIVAIDYQTGAVTEISRMNTPLEIAADAPVIVDVNPAADRLRFMSGTTNHRVNIDTGEVTVDGALKWDAADANMASPLTVAATGYINSYGKPEKTAMYNIDTGLNALLQQTAPNDGTNTTIGPLGVTLEGPVALDVATTADGANTVWLAANGGLHTVDLATGGLTGSWALTGAADPIRDIAILPAM